MRIASLLLAFCFTFNVMAASGTVSEFERAMDDYHYALSVEWDQQDQAFYDARTKEFFSRLKNLIGNEGLSGEQIMTVVEKRAGNKTAVNALKLKMELIQKNSSSEDLAALIKESSREIYAQGASWNGQAIVPVAIGLLIAGAIGYAVWWSATHECVSYENQYVCNTYSNCSYYGGGYNPNYGGGYYGGSYCYGSYTTCGYENVCTQYAKK